MFARPGSLLTESAFVVIASFLLLAVFQLYVDNVFIVTTNGLWKSVVVREWAEHPSFVNLDMANVLYFPVYGGMVRILDGLSVFPGLVWKQMALLNAAFAALILGAVYYWISALFESRRVGFLSALFYLGSGHFLTLSVINEDIMPGYFFILAAMILASVGFGKPTWARILGVSVVFSIGWLFEWRLLFPLLPPMLLALWLPARTWLQRLGWPLGFLAGTSILPALISLWVAVSQQFQWNAALAFFDRLFWVGKGVGTGWAGFSIAKLQLIWAGMTESVVGGRYLQSNDWMNHPANILEVFSGTLVLLLLGAVSIRHVWQRRHDPRVVAHAVIFGGTLLAGQFFNAYSQPQDPQMQLTVMPWIIPAWGVLMSGLLSGTRGRPVDRNSLGVNRVRGIRGAFLLSLFPMILTAPVIARERGGNTRYLNVLSRLEQELDPTRTVFLYMGFDALIPWQFTQWSASWSNVDGLPAAPASDPKFKWLPITDDLIRHPAWTPEQQAAELRRKIDHALSLGYRVVTNRMWEWPERVWLETTVTITQPGTALALRRTLLEKYHGDVVYVDPVEGPFFALSRRGEALQPSSDLQHAP